MDYKWTYNRWHVRGMEQYLAMQRNEILLHTDRLMNPENLTPSERSQSQQDHVSRDSVCEPPRLGKATGTETRPAVVRGRGEGRWGVTADGHRAAFQGGRRCKINCSDSCFCHSVAQSCLTLFCDLMDYSMLPSHSPSPVLCSNPYPSSRGCHPTISSSVVPFSSCPQSFPA